MVINSSWKWQCKDNGSALHVRHTSAKKGRVTIVNKKYRYRGTVICVVFCDSNYNKGDRYDIHAFILPAWFLNDTLSSSCEEYFLFASPLFC